MRQRLYLQNHSVKSLSRALFAAILAASTLLTYGGNSVTNDTSNKTETCSSSTCSVPNTHIQSTNTSIQTANTTIQSTNTTCHGNGSTGGPVPLGFTYLPIRQKEALIALVAIIPMLICLSSTGRVLLHRGWDKGRISTFKLMRLLPLPECWKNSLAQKIKEINESLDGQCTQEKLDASEFFENLLKASKYTANIMSIIVGLLGYDLAFVPKT